MLVLWAFLFWTAVGLFFASQTILLGGPDVTWQLALWMAMLGQLDEALDKRRFVRVHRSAIVNIDVIEELQQDPHGDYVVVLKDRARTEIRLGRRYRARLQDRLGQDF